MTKLLALAAFAAASIAVPASADKYVETRAAVSIADLDLTTPAGIAALDRRMASAVSRVCGTFGRDLGANRFVSTCRKAAFAQVAEQRAIHIAAAQTRAPRNALSAR